MFESNVNTNLKGTFKCLFLAALIIITDDWMIVSIASLKVTDFKKYSLHNFII